jgi:hypothetical protein
MATMRGRLGYPKVCFGMMSLPGQGKPSLTDALVPQAELRELGIIVESVCLR